MDYHWYAPQAETSPLRGVINAIARVLESIFCDRVFCFAAALTPATLNAAGMQLAEEVRYTGVQSGVRGRPTLAAHSIN